MSSATRTPDEISTEIAETRNRLAGTIDDLVYRTKPKTIISRQVATTKASVFDANGAPRMDRIAIVVGVVVGVVASIVVIRKVVG